MGYILKNVILLISTAFLTTSSFAATTASTIRCEVYKSIPKPNTPPLLCGNIEGPIPNISGGRLSRTEFNACDGIGIDVSRATGSKEVRFLFGYLYADQLPVFATAKYSYLKMKADELPTDFSLSYGSVQSKKGVYITARCTTR